MLTRPLPITITSALLHLSFSPPTLLMGSISSCYGDSRTRPPPPRSASSGWQHSFDQAPYSQYAQNYPVPVSNHSYRVPEQNGALDSQLCDNLEKKLDGEHLRIEGSYRSLEEVSQALARAGLDSSNMIIGIDFTKSNEWTGKESYGGRSLHNIGGGLNPYEQVITIVGKTLAAFDDDNFIPCFGFGDASTEDRDVFSFYPDGAHCNGFEDVLSRYRQLVPNLKLAGPTSFAPIIEMAMTVVEQKGGQYHVLLIIADGQVTRSVDTESGQLSPHEQKTVDAVAKASKLPLSIILVGVGDGPWDTMKEFDDNIPVRDFDNFQFVNFTEIMAKNTTQTQKETEFALSALMEIPSQYKAAMELNLMGGQRRNIPKRVALPTPVYGNPRWSNPNWPYENHVPAETVSSAPVPTLAQQICPICLGNIKNMAFGCGHRTCCECGQDIRVCPICRTRIETRIKLR